MKILIIGGVAGGASAATRARRVNPKAEITIFEKGQAISFANCGLPYHLGGEIEKRDKLLVATPHLFKNRFGIEVKTNHEVISIDRNNKKIIVRDLIANQNSDYNYDKLIISTGSKLRELPVFSNKYTNVFNLWTLNDLDTSLSFIKTHSIKRATVIGAGFVGLEVAEQLKHLNLEVDLVERGTQVLGPLDADMASFISKELEANGVKQHLGREVIKIESDNNQAKKLILDDNSVIETQLIFVGVGVLPESKLASEAGLEIGSAIKVNQFQQTSDSDIYAVGDASEYIYAPSNSPASIPLAGPANRAGRIAGEHAASGKAQFTQKVLGTSIVRVFKKAAAITGLTEKSCKRLNIDYTTSVISAAHHASYFPGAKELIIKLLFNETDGKILGAQIIGEEGVDKRIDVISTLITMNGTVKDMACLDLAYAPPFGSAKDPIHQIAFTALNHMDSRPKLLHYSSDLSNYQVIDVRTEDEIRRTPLSGATIIPIDHPAGDIRSRVSNLDPQKPTVVTCHSGKRAHVVASMLSGLGFNNIYNLTGGMMMRSISK